MKKFSKILFGVIAALVLCVTSINFSDFKRFFNLRYFLISFRLLVSLTLSLTDIPIVSYLLLF